MFELKYKAVDDDSIRPICPHCEQRIDSEIHYFEQAPPSSGMNIGIEIARVFICPHCHKIIGIGTVG